MPVNKDHCLLLADHVLTTKSKFNMAEHTTCLIKHSAVLANGRYRDDQWNSADMCRWLGVADDDDTRMNLYIAWGTPLRYHLTDITRQQAADMLRRLAATGKIKWRA